MLREPLSFLFVSAAALLLLQSPFALGHEVERHHHPAKHHHPAHSHKHAHTRMMRHHHGRGHNDSHHQHHHKEKAPKKAHPKAPKPRNATPVTPPPVQAPTSPTGQAPTGQAPTTSPASNLTTFGKEETGSATWFTATDPGGKCMLARRPDTMIAAMNGPDWQGSQACGMCIRITGPNNTTVDVEVTDETATHPRGWLDLGKPAFAKLGDPNLGQIPISWKQINCQTAGMTSGKAKVVWKVGSSEYWFGIQIRDSALPLVSVSIRPTGTSAWVALERTFYNFWLAEKGLDRSKGPFDVLVTYQDGSDLTLPNVGLNSVMAT